MDLFDTSRKGRQQRFSAALIAAAIVAANSPAALGNAVSISQDSHAGSSTSINAITINGRAGNAEIRVVNGRLWIGGIEIPPEATDYIDDAGRRYRIDRSGGQLSVQTVQPPSSSD